MKATQSPLLRPVVLLLLALAVGQPLHAQPDPLGGLDAYIENEIRAWEAPGLAIAVVKDDSVIFARGYGVRELGGSEPVDEHTIFAVASTTKAMTVAALGMLVDEEKLAWDDRVVDHLPGFRLADPYVTRELTVRDLITHRSGLSRSDRLWWASPHDRDEVVRRARNLDSNSGFRAGYGYHNVMFIVAGEVVEAVSGRSWDDFVAERLFQPLGMDRSSTSVQALEGADNVATPHARIDGEVRPIGWRSYDNLGAAGSVNSSAWEMARWLKLHLGDGQYGGGQLLSEDVIREMQVPQTVIRSSERDQRLYPATHFRAYGLGWFLRDHHGRKVVEHTGSLDGMRTQVGMIPEENLGVAVITNMQGSNLTTALMYRVFDAYLGEPERDWSTDLLAVADTARVEAEERRDSIAEARVTGTDASLPVSAYAGTYENGMFGEVELGDEGGQLVVRYGSDYRGTLEHWHYDTFRASWEDPYMGRSFVTFTLDAAGDINAMTVEGLGRFGRVADDG